LCDYGKTATFATVVESTAVANTSEM